MTVTEMQPQLEMPDPREVKVDAAEFRAELARRRITGMAFAEIRGMPQRTVSYIMRGGNAGGTSLVRMTRGLLRLGIPLEKVFVPVDQ
jgi:hypothetical protein